LTSRLQNVKKLTNDWGVFMNKFYLSLLTIATLALLSCSGGGSRPKNDKDERGINPITAGSGEDIFKKVADAIVQQNLEEVKRLYNEVATIRFRSSCFNSNFADSIYYNLTLPQIAAIYATNTNNSNPDTSIFKFILEHTGDGKFIHYSCDNSKYPIHILAAYGHYNAMSILIKHITYHSVSHPNSIEGQPDIPAYFTTKPYLIEQIPDPDAFKGIDEYAQHSIAFIDKSKTDYQELDINLNGDFVKRTPLYTAIYYKRYDIIDLLLDKENIGCQADWKIMANVAEDRGGSSDRIKQKCQN